MNMQKQLQALGFRPLLFGGLLVGYEKQVPGKGYMYLTKNNVRAEVPTDPSDFVVLEVEGKAGYVAGISFPLAFLLNGTICLEV